MTIEPAMRRAGLLKARRLRYWLLKYLAGQVGQKKEVLAVEPLPNRWRVLFPDLLLEAFLTVPASLDLKPGDTVRVRLLLWTSSPGIPCGCAWTKSPPGRTSSSFPWRNPRLPGKCAAPARGSSP